jgi:AhpD family alkylhydroperoxidase
MSAIDNTLKDIKKTLGMVPGFMKALPEEALVHEWPIWKRYTIEESEIPEKYRELIGLAIAANIKCPYCLFFHSAMAKMAGATNEELAEVAMLAGLAARWNTILHAQQYDMDIFEKEGQKIGEFLSKKK